jgi:hypothetical protein
MLLIEDLLVEEDLTTALFNCDLEKCKGACCTFPGETGAPLLDSEVELCKEAYPIVKEYLSERNIAYIEKHGVTEGTKGSYSTVCINNRDCVFVYFDGDIAKCAIEKGYFAKKLDFRKPLSCHLYPIRVSKFGVNYLYYSQIEECQPGRKKGQLENIPLYATLKEALIRAYGSDWYEIFVSYSKKRQKNI